MDIPCGYCIGCRIKRARAWAIRCIHETQLHEQNWFITLTYDDKHYQAGLEYNQIQEFIRAIRCRRRYFDVTLWQWAPRYFACGEYGSVNQRPHFHLLLFGLRLHDLQPFGKDLYRSPFIEHHWPKGYSSIGQVSYQSAGYVARYSLKKVHGPKASSHYCRVDRRTGEFIQVDPEMAHMSLKPGIGYEWYRRHWPEVSAARDGVVINGQTKPTPRYYDKLLLEMEPDLREWRDYTRYVNSKTFEADCTPERLAVREYVTTHEMAQRSRKL